MLLSLLALPPYLATKTDIEADKAFFNDRQEIAGEMYSKDHRSKIQFFYSHGKLRELPEVTEIAGLNNKGELAVWTKNGTGIWANGRLRFPPKSDERYRYLGRPAGIDDQSRLICVDETGSEGMFAVRRWPDKKYWGHTIPRPTAIGADGSIAGVQSQGLRFQRSRDAYGSIWTEGKTQTIGDADRMATPMCVSPFHRVGGAFNWYRHAEGIPFDWTNGTFRELPLPGTEEHTGHVNGLNDRGEDVGDANWVVKETNGSTHKYHGLLWVDGKLFDLNDLVPPGLGLEIDKGLAITANGVILADASPPTSHWPHTLVILTPSIHAAQKPYSR